MKILILTDGFPPFSRGGAEMAAYRLAKSYAKRGHRVVVVTTVQQHQETSGEQDSGEFGLYKLYANYHERWRAYLSIYNPILLKKLAEILKKEKPDVIHIHNVHKYFSYYSLKLIRQLDIKSILTIHDCMPVCYKKFTCFISDDYNEKNASNNYKINSWRCLRCQRKRFFPLRNIIIRHFINNYPDTVITVSAELKKLLEINGIRCDDYVHHGLDPENFKTDGEQVNLFKNKYHLQDKKIIFFGGRLSAAKGTNQILSAVSRLKSKIANVILLVAGTSSEEIERAINDLGLKERVILTGWLDQQELLAAYAVADLVVYPSLCFDTFGLMNLEAMAMRKPVIATCFGGSKEIVVNRVTGFIVNPLKIDQMAELIRDLLNDQIKSRQMGEAGHVRFLESFTIDRETEEYLQLFHQPNV